jgi:hypothetical protein
MLSARTFRAQNNDLYRMPLSYSLCIRLASAGFRSQAELAATPFHIIVSRAALRGTEITAVERAWTDLNLNSNGPRAA